MGAVSVLRSRIITGNQMVTGQPNPGGTSATPRVMPLAVVTYAPMDSWYNEVWWQPPADGGPNAVPIPALMKGSMGAVIPAGRA